MLVRTIRIGNSRLTDSAAIKPTDGRPLTCHVEDGIGILQVLFQNLDGLGGWQNQQFDL